MIKLISFNRAIEIITSSNPNMKKFYKKDYNKIYFWISINPYIVYQIKINSNKSEDVINFTKEIINLLLENNFIGVNNEKRIQNSTI